MAVLVLGIVLAHAAEASADLVVYDDALRNAFQDYSYGGGSNFANAAPVHSGTRSISLAGSNYNALSFFHDGGAFGFAQYAGLHFWIHGGSAGGQQLQLFLQNSGAGTSADVPLNGYIAGGAPAANAWREVSVPLASIPALAALGQFDRIDIQSESAGTQPTVYVDDVVLTSPAATADPIFADGFDGGALLTIARDAPIDGLSGDRFGWRDSANRPRAAVLAHNDAGSTPNGSRGGELREFRYQAGAATRVVRPTDDSFGGFGYVVSHTAHEDTCTGGGDSSSLGHFTPGQFQRVFEGRHHAIFRFTLAYPRYCTTAAPAQQYDVPVTIDWVFSTGRDDPLWAVTWDLSGVPVNRLEDDSRAPYGQLRIDGAANDAARATIGGVAWGDYYRFASSTDPVSFASSWSWNQPNTIPFVTLWTSGVDATMGLVQTQTIRQQDAGGYWGQDLWNRTSAQGNGCTDPGSVYAMPCDYNWPYQSINYELYGGPTRNARLAWGTNFGFLGQQSYQVRGNAAYGGGGNGTALPGDPRAPGWPKKSYSVYIVLGAHSADPVGAQVRQIETIQSLTLGASVGSVIAQGAAGIADASLVTYQPAGYDPVYGALTFQASGNRLDANIGVGAGTLRHPLLIVRGYTGALPSSLKWNGAALTRDVDYFPSIRSGANELWITLNRDLAGGGNRIEIAP
ncbi:hypothetical protein [Dokdonella sp.]|uniref:hypothetical protein n=1 Tax=Dokdonella sp. TaxID=2291710 RepID=UPI001B0CCDD5|nr:hypothetical protein [Dokdonella sp.]MBO9664182.1 hypothetical protein [Dokdonella sp.]